MQRFSKWKQVLLVLLALVYSGNPAPGFIFPLEPQLVILSVFYGFLLIRRYRRIISYDFVIFAIIFAMILMIQCVSFSFYPFTTIAGFFIRLFIGYAAIRLIDDFPRIYVQVMVALAIISFVFFLPYQYFSFLGLNIRSYVVDIASFLGTVNPGSYPLFLHTFLEDQPYRNAGMFWEPGAFAGYLILALIFLAFVKNNMPRKQYFKYLFLLCAAVFSTLSTTGYIALFLIPFLHSSWRQRKKSLRQRLLGFLCYFCVFLPLLIGGGYYIYNTFPFMREKIEASISESDAQASPEWYRSRIGTFILDWEYIKTRPLTGWGLHSTTRHALHPWMEVNEGMGNGFSDSIAKYGLIGFLAWLSAVFSGFRRYTGSAILYSALACCVILVVLQGECFNDFPLFWGLAFIRRPKESVFYGA